MTSFFAQPLSLQTPGQMLSGTENDDEALSAESDTENEATTTQDQDEKTASAGLYFSHDDYRIKKEKTADHVKACPGKTEAQTPRLTEKLDARTSGSMKTESRASTSKHAANSFNVQGMNLKITHVIETTSAPLSVDFDAHGDSVAVGYQDGVVRVYSWSDFACRYALITNEILTQNQSVTCVRFLPQRPGCLMASYTKGGGVRVWHISTKTVMLASEGSSIIHGFPGDAMACVLTPDASSVVVVGDEGHARMFDFQTTSGGASSTSFGRHSALDVTTVTGGHSGWLGRGAGYAHLSAALKASDNLDQMNGHRERIFAATFYTPADKTPRLITAGWDNTVQIWDTDSHEGTIENGGRQTSGSVGEDTRAINSETHIFGVHVCGDRGIDVDNERGHLLTGSWRRQNKLQVWNLNDLPSSPTMIKTLELPKNVDSQLYVAQWLGASYILIAGTLPNSLAILRRSSLSVCAAIVDMPSGVCSATSYTCRKGAGGDLHTTNLAQKPIDGPTRICAVTEDRLLFMTFDPSLY